MTIQVSAFAWAPPFAQGFVRDLRVRWALEEAGMPYEAALIGGPDLNSEVYRRWQPFGQVPAYRDDEAEMFESAAIVLHIAEKSEKLAPTDVAGRARVTSWAVAAINSVEPFIQSYFRTADAPAGEAWASELRAEAETQLKERLAALAAWLGDKDYLEGAFTAGDLMMTAVVRELADSGILAEFPNLDAYRARCEARPAFGRALEAQMRTFRENAPD
jgi:glutathione S-transferase